MPKKKSKVVAPPVHVIVASDMRIENIPNKGMGVVAAKTLPPNSQMLYEGEEIDEKMKDKLFRRTKKPEKRDYASYIIASGRAGVWIDAHPRLRGNETLFANRINEPSAGQTANMVLKHRKVEGITQPVLITTEEIKPGEELTFKYDRAFKRVGYRAGRKAKEPAWLKTREN